MIFSFKDIDNNGLYEKSRVIVVAGQHNLFNRLFIDRVRNSVKVERKNANSGNTLMSEFFGDEEETADDISQGSIDLETFFKVVNTPSLIGRWYCCTEYQFISKKDKEKIKNYIKRPSENGVLVLVANEWNDIKELRRLQSLRSSQYSHMVELGFPGRKQLFGIVSTLFRENNKNIGELAAKLFIMRMSTAYDEYEETIQVVCERLSEKTDVSYDDMKEAMKGIENFIMDDFIKALLKPVNSIKVVKSRKVYKILDSLMEELTAREVVNKLKFRFKDMIEFRFSINKGVIPVRGRYNADKIKERIDENSRIKKIGNMAFKRNAYIASMTSIGDWLYMYNILDKVRAGADDSEYFHSLIALMHRGVMSNDRLMNEIYVKNTLSESLVDVNKLFCTDGWQSLRRITDIPASELEVVDSRIVDTCSGEIIK